MIDLSPRVLARWGASLLLGLAVGFVGTGVHRAVPPWGLVLALVAVVVMGVLARAWAGAGGAFVAALGVATAVAMLASQGPGGDVLVPAEPIGYVWYGGALATALAWLAPRRWFADRPVSGSVPVPPGDAP